MVRKSVPIPAVGFSSLAKRVAGINHDGSLPIALSDSAMIDAFDRIRVSTPETIFDSKQIFDNLPLFWDDQEVSGTGTSSTYTKAKACTNIAVSANTAGKRVRQTFMRFNYQPGKSQLILMTTRLTTSGTGIKASVGQFDDNNGIFFTSDNGVLKVVIRSSTSGSAVDREVTQSNFNIDTMDGNGPSGITIDPTKTQILIFDYEWLGVGRVRMGFVIDGIIHYCHNFNNTNNMDVVYMSTPNLPLRYEIENDGTGGAADIDHICCTVMSEGGTNKLGVLRHYNSPSLSALGSGTSYISMAGRLKTTHFGANIELENISVIASSTNDFCKWELWAGGTYSGTLNYVDFQNSAVQIADGAKTVIHNRDGILIDGGFFTSSLPSANQVPNALKLGSSIDDTPQEFYFVVTPITNNITVESAITWRELN